jgi:hypothetical protein
MATATIPQTTLTNEEELYWLALRMMPGLGARRSSMLLERFRGVRAIFHASAAELEGAGMPGALARSIASGCSFEDAAEQQQLRADASSCSRRSMWEWSEPAIPRPTEWLRLKDWRAIWRGPA